MSAVLDYEEERIPARKPENTGVLAYSLTLRLRLKFLVALFSAIQN